MNNKTPAIAMILKVIAHVRYVILLTLDSSFSPTAFPTSVLAADYDVGNKDFWFNAHDQCLFIWT